MKIFNLPDLGEGLAEAEIREWYVKEGDQVVVDQPLVSMETAKAVVDVPSPYAGKIVALHGKSNDIIQTGAPLITFDTGEDEVKERPKSSVVGALEEGAGKWDESDVIIGAVKTKTERIKAMPAARVLAAQMNVDLAQITGTGPQGLITPDDVKKFITQKAPAQGATFKGEALHGVRRVMAQTMAQSQREIVPVTIVEDVNISHLPASSDITALVLKAIASAAKVEPSLNAWFDGSTLTRDLRKEVNVGLAVDTSEGLFVPVIKDVDAKSNEALRERVNTYKATVKDRTVAQADMQGATITLSNFGTIIGRYATPIIVPPAVAILGCGRSREVPIVQEGKVMPGRILPLSLTFDHRAVTGGEATRFLGAVIKYLNEVH